MWRFVSRRNEGEKGNCGGAAQFGSQKRNVEQTQQMTRRGETPVFGDRERKGYKGHGGLTGGGK